MGNAVAQVWSVTLKNGTTQTVTGGEYSIDETGGITFNTAPPLTYPNGTWVRVDALHPVQATTEEAPPAEARTERKRAEKSEGE